jgi:glyoxylase-like metal-dependent hydrolase (beta-lactamase superfamily II)
MGTAEEAVQAGITGAGWGIEQLAGMLLTHCHVDHVLGVPPFQARGVRLLASAATADLLRRADPQIWCEHPERIPAMVVDEELADGQRLTLPGLTIECLATPGHTRGCMSYIVETGNEVLAVTGDLLMPDPRYVGWAGGPDHSAAQSLASLERLLARGVTRAFTGHGTVDDAHAWLRQGIAYGRAGRWIIEIPPKMT